MQKILIIEDDLLIAELERDYLEANGFEARLCDDGKKGLDMALSEDFDLVLLDLMLPGLSGFEVCRALRREKDIPVIMVTAKKDDIDKIRGLGLGADDYVVKPFSPAELVARVRAHIGIHQRLLGKSREAAENVIEAGDLQIGPLSRRVTLGGREVSLTNKEFELLLLLASHPDMVFSREKLFNRVWGGDSLGNTATVTVHINRLREKIERDPACPEHIETVWGAGYRFSL